MLIRESIGPLRLARPLSSALFLTDAALMPDEADPRHGPFDFYAEQQQAPGASLKLRRSALCERADSALLSLASHRRPEVSDGSA